MIMQEKKNMEENIKNLQMQEKRMITIYKYWKEKSLYEDLVWKVNKIVMYL